MSKKLLVVTKKPKQPLVRCGGTMTESAYLAWIRSALRSKSLRWPPRASALVAARQPYYGENKLQKWVYQCAICKHMFKGKEVVVDHFPKPAGSILSTADIGPFAENLFCEIDNLRCLCSQCHDVHTLAEKNGITFDEAVVEKRIIEICKQSPNKVIDYLAKYGYNGNCVSNSTKRKLLVTRILKEKLDNG